MAQSVNKQYGVENLGDKILAAFKAAGKDTDNLTRDDLAMLSEFHIGSRPATRELAKLGGIEKGMSVIDLGSGIGGPARTLADEFGCKVTALEITNSFHEVAQMLTERVGVKGIEFVLGNALDVPKPDASFDQVWLQHVQMNIEDKKKLVSEAFRLLKPGGRFVLHEIFAGTNQPVAYPAPWADDEKISFLVPSVEFKKLAMDAGFKEVAWKNVQEASIKFFDNLDAKLKARPADAPPPLGINLLMGPSSPAKLANVLKNLKEDRIEVIKAVFERPI
ncbi:MAG: methyltransferase domain-containing protein [Acidobacteriota bacterium]